MKPHNGVLTSTGVSPPLCIVPWALMPKGYPRTCKSGLRPPFAPTLFLYLTRVFTDRDVYSGRLLPGIAPKLEALRTLYEGKKIIVGRDKLDVVKGVLQ